MIDVYIIEEIERERRKDRRDEARVWISDPQQDSIPEHPEDSPKESPRVIVIDL